MLYQQKPVGCIRSFPFSTVTSYLDLKNVFKCDSNQSTLLYMGRWHAFILKAKPLSCAFLSAFNLTQLSPDAQQEVYSCIRQRGFFGFSFLLAMSLSFIGLMLSWVNSGSSTCDDQLFSMFPQSVCVKEYNIYIIAAAANNNNIDKNSDNNYMTVAVTVLAIVF